MVTHTDEPPGLPANDSGGRAVAAVESSAGSTEDRAAWAVVVAGVSGAGKSTIADLVADATGALVADGDDFHSAAALAKMRSGTPLTDADRAPWLARIAAWIDEQHRLGRSTVVSCSALRRRHRDELATGRPWVGFCMLEAPAQVLESRLARRSGHFMPAALLPSQLAILEPLEPDENGVTLDATEAPEQVAASVLRRLRSADDR